jgi:magnesium-transporting ATPase (P-type)
MVIIFLLQLCLVVLCGVLNVVLFEASYTGSNFGKLVLHQEKVSGPIQAILTSLSYFILLNTLIPISLLVSIEVVKYCQGFFIGADLLMSRVDNEGNIVNPKAFRSIINE